MSVQGLNFPDAKDLNTLDVMPKRKLESSNHLLDDHAALQCLYEQNGYILLRQVLDPQSVEAARDAMLAVAARHGIVEPGDTTATWTGKPFAGGMEESDEFSGISKKLFANPHNHALLSKVLGEKACMVPIVQYRTYPPGGSVTGVHQDGFFSPGIQDYKPVWVTLTPCQREVGGLMIAVGQNNRGYFHNVAKPSPFAIPEGFIDPDSWATTDYFPGDLLLVHPYAPHASMRNTSKRLRVTFDSRVQSAARPSAVNIVVMSVTATSLTCEVEGEGESTYRVDAGSYVRPINVARREPFERFTEVTQPGMKLVLVREGDYAATLRKATQS